MCARWEVIQLQNESVTLCELDLAAPKLRYRDILTKGSLRQWEVRVVSPSKEDMVLRL